jgi:CheY-like chemotaxis protein
MMLKLQEKGKHWYEVDPPLKAQVLQKIKDNGPLYARDFETPKSNSKEMWGWKPAKQALHELFMEGRVAVVSRDGFQRLYDLAERVIPTFQSQDRFQSQPQFHTQTHTQSSISHSIWHRCQQAMQAHGIVSIPEIRYQRDFSTEQVENILEEQESLGDMLRLLGYRVTATTSSADALGMFQARPADFDLIITDMTMPGLTGDRLTAEVRTDRPDLPVIICTGYNRRLSDNNPESLAVQAILMKPVEHIDFARTVRAVLDGEDRSKAAA